MEFTGKLAALAAKLLSLNLDVYIWGNPKYNTEDKSEDCTSIVIGDNGHILHIGHSTVLEGVHLSRGYIPTREHGSSVEVGDFGYNDIGAIEKALHNPISVYTRSKVKEYRNLEEWFENDGRHVFKKCDVTDVRGEYIAYYVLLHFSSEAINTGAPATYLSRIIEAVKNDTCKRYGFKRAFLDYLQGLGSALLVDFETYRQNMWLNEWRIPHNEEEPEKTFYNEIYKAFMLIKRRENK